MSSSLVIKINPGSVAPRYTEETKQLIAETAVITEKGMQNGLPMIDIQMKDTEGNEYFFMLTGRLFQMLGKAIDGVNIRNHGAAEPVKPHDDSENKQTEH